MNGDLIATIARAFRRVAVPLAAYYAVTVAVPLANGAAQSAGSFVRHTIIVLAVPPLLVVGGQVLNRWLFHDLTPRVGRSRGVRP